MPAVLLRMLMGAFVFLLSSPSIGHAGEADLKIPSLPLFSFEWLLLTGGMFVCVGGLIFGFRMYRHLAALPVHSSMRDVSELIYATCRTYMLNE